MSFVDTKRFNVKNIVFLKTTKQPQKGVECNNTLILLNLTKAPIMVIVYIVSTPHIFTLHSSPLTIDVLHTIFIIHHFIFRNSFLYFFWF